jgi:hypothetical protein
VYERHRHLARAEPLLLARGRLERTQEQPTLDAARTRASGASGRETGKPPEEIRPVINVLVRELVPLERFLPGGVDEELAAGATLHRLPGAADRAAPGAAEPGAEEAVDGDEVGSSMRAVAPPIQSFAAGRRR